MVEKIVIGKDRDDLLKYGHKGTVLIGKHIVGKGEEAHLTNPVLMDVSRPHVVLICGKRGTGKCVHGDTLIPLADGSLVPISELMQDKEAVYSLDDSLKIVETERTEFFQREVETLLKIRLRSGKEIKLTPEHPLLTLKGWKPAIELNIGSRIATPRRLAFFGNKTIPENEVKLLAYLIAEGHLGNNFILFSNTDPIITEEFIDSVKKFDPSLRIIEHSRQGCYRITKSEEEIKRMNAVHDPKSGCFVSRKSSSSIWTHKLGIYGLRSKDKLIPGCIFKLPKKQLAIFLNRLFSCDGSVYKRRKRDEYIWEISYSSASKKLIYQVQHLLLRFGVLSKIRQRKIKLKSKEFEAYEIIITGPHILTFIEEIGFFGSKGEKQKTCKFEILQIRRNPNVDTIPSEIWDIYKPKNWAELGRRMGYSIPKGFRTSINYSPSRQKLLQIAEIENNDLLRLLATSDIFWDEIMAIEKMEGKFEVYDMTVPKLHNFLANDIIVHNSYSAAIVAEEITKLPNEIRQNISVVMIDTMGIYWSMKRPNDRDMKLLREWDSKPQAIECKLFIPQRYVDDYKKAGVEFDSSFSLPAGELTAEEWIVTFGFSLVDEFGIAIERAVKNVVEKFGESYSIQDIINAIESDKRTDQKVKDALTNRFLAAQDWGLFEKKGTKIDDLIQPGKITILDVSHYMRVSGAWSIRGLLVGLLSRKIFTERLMARKSEEFGKITGQTKKTIPMVWIIIDEAHQFAPNEGVTAATEPLLTLAKEGREPGISLILITQRPNKLHEDVLSQADLIISHRLTSKADIEALRSIMQTYMLEDIEEFISAMPRQKGTAIVLDDNSERLYTIQVKPRLSWHAGGSPIAIKEKGFFED